MNKTIVTILIVVILLLGFSYYWQNKGVDKSNLPQYALRTSEVEVAYRFAVKHPQKLSNIPCYCNCGSVGHDSVKDCFIKKIQGNKVVFNDHGSDCGICYSIVLDVKKLFEQDKSMKKIRNFIDNKYSQYGEPTDTPHP